MAGAKRAHCHLQITHNFVHFPLEHPVAKSNEDFDELVQETFKFMALTHDLDQLVEETSKFMAQKRDVCINLKNCPLVCIVPEA
jgi:hypothetical protein